MSTFTCSPSCDDLADYCFIFIQTGRGQDVEQEEGFCHVSTEALSVMQHIFPPEQGLRSSVWSVKWIDFPSKFQQQ